jgi:hypothetical protein
VEGAKNDIIFEVVFEGLKTCLNPFTFESVGLHNVAKIFVLG